MKTPSNSKIKKTSFEKSNQIQKPKQAQATQYSKTFLFILVEFFTAQYPLFSVHTHSVFSVQFINLSNKNNVLIKH